MSDIFEDVESVLKEMGIKYRDLEPKKIDSTPEKNIVEKVFIVPTLKKSRFFGLSQEEDPIETLCAINADIYAQKRLEPFYVGIRRDLGNAYVSTFVDFSEDGNLSKWATIKAEARNYKL